MFNSVFNNVIVYKGSRILFNIAFSNWIVRFAVLAIVLISWIGIAKYETKSKMATEYSIVKQIDKGCIVIKENDSKYIIRCKPK